MNHLLEITKTTLELGLVYALVVLGTHISSHIIKFDDLSTEGSFGSGGALTALLLLINAPAWTTIACALAAGGIIGMITGILHTKLGLNNLISGIVVTAGLFSLNLKVAGTNIVVPQNQTIFTWLSTTNVGTLAVIATICITCVMIVQWFLTTEVGTILKAIGNNTQLLRSLGKSVSGYKILGLAISNSIVALAGALLVHYTGLYSITGSIGTLVIALAGLIIGQALCKKSIWGVVVGAIGYQAIITLTLELQLDPGWNKLITAILIVILIVVRNNKDTQPTEGVSL